MGTRPNPLFNAYPIKFVKHIMEDYDRLSSRTLRRPVPLNFIAPHFAFGLSVVFGLYAYMQRCEMVFPHVFGFHTGLKLYPYFCKILEILDNPAMARSMKDIEQIKRVVGSSRSGFTSNTWSRECHQPNTGITLYWDLIMRGNSKNWKRMQKRLMLLLMEFGTCNKYLHTCRLMPGVVWNLCWVKSVKDNSIKVRIVLAVLYRR